MSLGPKEVNFNEVWGNIRETAKSVITLENVNREIWNNRFSDVYQLCVALPEPLADKLYFETKQFLENHVKNMLATRVQYDSSKYNDPGKFDLLQAYYDAWSEYSKGIGYINTLYSYLNQQHIKKQKISDTEFVYGMSSFNLIKLE